jgi:hypothetical protein
MLGGQVEAHCSASDLLGHSSVDHEARKEERDRGERTETSMNSTTPMVLGQVERGLGFSSERRVLRMKKGAETWSASSSQHRVIHGGARCSRGRKGKERVGGLGLGLLLSER